MDKKGILEHINSVEDLRALPAEDLPALADEIRCMIEERVRENGGHLASNLGTVELTLVLHRVFDTPCDTLIWDVGHQAYAHKIITDRKNAFAGIRRPGGISGFTLRAESAFDPFGAGHSSTSLSAAQGFAAAAKLDGSERYTIAVLGDGAYTGGMIHEALNNVDKDQRLILILNDNKMSISRSTGGFARHLANVRATSGYHNTKRRTRNFLQKIPLIGKPLFKAARSVKKSFKNLFFESNYFEDIGLYYLGPVDGHDFKKLTNVLNAAKEYKGACIVHVRTVKGKGYAPAERKPEEYHGVKPIDPEAGGGSFSKKAGDILTARAAENKDICVVTAAMKDGCGMADFARAYPDRFFDVGIAEEHAAVFSAGLAAAGKRPVFAVYSTFMQRCYDNIVHDIALQGLPTVFLIDRAGISEGDGPTHNGIFDVAMLTGLPGVTLYAPSCLDNLETFIDSALAATSPVFIRYPASSACGETLKKFTKIDDNIYATPEVSDSPDCVIVTYGRIVCEAVKAADLLGAHGIRCGVILTEKLLPLGESSERLQNALPSDCGLLVFLEEGIKNGGFGECVSELMRKDERFGDRKVLIKAIEDPFARPAAGQSVYQAHGLSSEYIFGSVYAAFPDRW